MTLGPPRRHGEDALLLQSRVLRRGADAARHSVSLLEVTFGIAAQVAQKPIERHPEYLPVMD